MHSLKARVFPLSFISICSFNAVFKRKINYISLYLFLSRDTFAIPSMLSSSKQSTVRCSCTGFLYKGNKWLLLKPGKNLVEL
mmetsp:Transcript_20859/g.34098  ORF Transcript_20859/g.34098 Transcript_20859/m.34098 type:complete len:82 (+) Transcript_20859:136-381(+)